MCHCANQNNTNTDLVYSFISVVRFVPFDTTTYIKIIDRKNNYKKEDDTIQDKKKGRERDGNK